MLVASDNILRLQKEELAEIIRFLHAKGWTPATSSNFSFRIAQDGFFVSESGIDKSIFSEKHFIEVDASGQPVNDVRKPSAEVQLHTWIYDHTDAGCVLHTHSVSNTVLSKLHETDGSVRIHNFELLKALEGITTHEATVEIPVVSNSQNMADIIKELDTRIKGPVRGFLIAGHGFYTWGKNISSAKRHMEAFEFLFTCLLKLKKYGSTEHS